MKKSVIMEDKKYESIILEAKEIFDSIDFSVYSFEEGISVSEQYQEEQKIITSKITINTL